MWTETIEQCLNMMVMDPYPGFSGKYFSMPCRNVVPKPVQKPHPPVWVACSNRETIKLAAKLGLGALTFAFVDPAEAKHWVDDYYRIFKSECVPIGHAVNPNVCMVSGSPCMRIERRRDGAARTGSDSSAMRWRITTSSASTNPAAPISGRISSAPARLCRRPAPIAASAIPRSCASTIAEFEAAGVDQVAFLQQGGRNEHRHICEALELFAAEVMPEFKARAAEREARKMAELAPYIEAAMARKERMDRAHRRGDPDRGGARPQDRRGRQADRAAEAESAALGRGGPGDARGSAAEEDGGRRRRSSMCASLPRRRLAVA